MVTRGAGDSAAATSASTGRVDATKVNATLDELLARFRELRSRGEGYLEVSTSDRAYPAIMMGFRNGRGVIHVLEAPESLALARGDNSVPADEEIEVPIFDEPAVFTGEVVMTLDHAWQFVENFARTGSVGDYENWFQA
jgi:hypothetical protein